MVNFLIYPTINSEHGFPEEVNRAIAGAPEVSDVTSDLLSDPENPIRQRLDTLYTVTTVMDGGTP